MLGRLLIVFCLIVPAAVRAEGVLVLGDSISAAYGIDETEGWVQLLRQRLDTQCSALPVVNASVSGDTSDGGRVRLPALLERHQPDTVVIELGGNDGLRGLPPRRLAGNLETMIRLSREAGAEPVLLGMRIPPNYGRAYTRLFEQAFKDVATDTGVPFLPFLLDGVVEAGQLQGDGIHPTAEAQPRLLDNAWPVIETALPDEACE
ncbi:arylesterase [Alloalcanivorax profundimaris]|uniref:arylesterase n=1 Tax=Alloalcanivorax profundimaris TaxID=2735259 RepID=UPI000C5D90A0|nr:arylesterase [Alloalcanivorax profundimaris]MAO59964.1 arylesterase [Alcanivorax sp.]MBM1144741.1 arylesterase [Alcanivorax sp. ZXX171]MBF1801356.1 arylesterase [Alloalcanivorax profundimaris]MBI54803.1 arylesterase [Alcanivorax sp.]MBU57439.1 arylesterase [Alcanivorax sp.]|tara:strand:+ start:79 stop:693 length:615 start_codon:yes stop_codon:yes gene_type:complete